MAEEVEKDNHVVDRWCMYRCDYRFGCYLKKTKLSIYKVVRSEFQKETFSKIEKRHTSNNSTAEQISGK